MTATTDQRSTNPEVPAWLNLDAYCSPVVRDAMSNAADDLEGVLDAGELERVLRNAYRARLSYEDGLPVENLPDDFAYGAGVGSVLTGNERLTHALWRIATLASVAVGEGAPHRDHPLPVWAERGDEVWE